MSASTGEGSGEFPEIGGRGGQGDGETFSFTREKQNLLFNRKGKKAEQNSQH